MTTQLYLQKAEMQLSRGLEEKALESLLSALACQNRDTVSETQTRCLLAVSYTHLTLPTNSRV